MEELHATEKPGSVVNIASAHPPVRRRSEAMAETSPALRRISRSEVSALKAGELAVALPLATKSSFDHFTLDPKAEAKESPEIDTSLGFESGIDEIFDQVWVKVQRRLTQANSEEDINEEQEGIRHHNIQSIIVTSWLENEGTSTVALGLAGRAAASLPGKVCLVDADFHAQGLTRASRCHSRPGLAEILLEEATLEQALVHSRHSPFAFIPAGRKIDIESLATDVRLQHVIRSLEDRFRYVFYDTSSLKRAVEAYRWGRFVVNAILVVRAGVTRQQTIIHAVDQMQLHGMQLLGTVLNQRQDVIPNWLYPYV
jgi:Mrp family chromosome partitioning ATPase